MDSSENVDEKIKLSSSGDFSKFLAKSTELEVVINREDSESLEGTCSISVELREPLLGYTV